MSVRNVTATILKSDGTPWVAAEVTFILDKVGVVVSPPDLYPPLIVTVVTDAAGRLAGATGVPLWANAEGLTTTKYTCVLPGSASTKVKSFKFQLPAGVGTVDLSDLKVAGLTVVTPDDPIIAVIQEMIDDAGAGGGTWGGITGTLSDQTDLQTALNLKGNITSQTFVTPNIGVASGTTLALTGAIQTGVGGLVAGTVELTQGTAPSLGTTSVKMYAPTGVTSYGVVLPGASATGFLLGTNAANINTWSFVGSTGTGSVVLAAAPALTGTTTAVGLTLSGVFTARNASATILNVGTVATAALVVDSGTYVSIAGAGLKWGGTQKLADSVTSPTISSGFGTSPSVIAHNGTVAFEIDVGTGGSATSGVIGLPTASVGWVCHVQNKTTQSSTVHITKQTASTTTTATIGNFNTSGAAAAWAASDRLLVSCRAY